MVSEKVLRRVINRPLKNGKRKVLIPSASTIDSVHTPKLDEAMHACLVPKSAKTYDRYLSKLQQFSIDTMGPLIWVGEYAEKSSLPAVKQAMLAAITQLTSPLNGERA